MRDLFSVCCQNALKIPYFRLALKIGKQYKHLIYCDLDRLSFLNKNLVTNLVTRKNNRNAVAPRRPLPVVKVENPGRSNNGPTVITPTTR